jgi:hypothetical protein
VANAATYQLVLPVFGETVTVLQQNQGDLVHLAVPIEDIEQIEDKSVRAAVGRQLKQQRLGHTMLTFPVVDLEGNFRNSISIHNGRRWTADSPRETAPAHEADTPFEIFQETHARAKPSLGLMARMLLRLHG